MRVKVWHLASALVGAMAVAAVAAGSVKAQEDGLPDGPGKQALVDSCTSCHDTGPIVGQRHTASEWTDVITQMIGLGASLSDQQTQAVVGYLAANYGPAGAPAAAPQGAPAPATPAASAPAPAAPPAN